MDGLDTLVKGVRSVLMDFFVRLSFNAGNGLVVSWLILMDVGY